MDDGSVVHLLVACTTYASGVSEVERGSETHEHENDGRARDGSGNLAETLVPIPQEMGKLTAQVGALSERLGAVEVRLGTVESQIVQLRTEMRDEFAAVRGEMSSGLSGLRGEIAEVLDDIAALGRRWSS